MNQTRSQLTDNVLGDAAALDAVLGCFGIDATNFLDSVIETAGAGPATWPEALPTRTADPEQQKRRHPWLGA